MVLHNSRLSENAVDEAELRQEKSAEPDINNLHRTFIEAHKADNPSDEKVYWIKVKPWQIATYFMSSVTSTPAMVWLNACSEP